MTELISVAVLIVAGPNPLTLAIFTVSTCLLAVVVTLVTQLNPANDRRDDTD